MAPKKRSKKPAANPARGFATTSTVSKAKEAIADEQVEAAPQDHVVAPVHSSGSTAKTEGKESGTDRETSLAHLTPEQLEAQLEESDLQILVEQNSSRSDKEVARHVSRLHTERRLMRSAAEHLATSAWLQPDILGSILDSVVEDQGDASMSGHAEGREALDSLPTNDLSVRIWTLEKALRSLGFTADKAHEAIISLLSHKVVLSPASIGGSKDTLWGLEECLTFLASQSNRDELPDYDSQRTEKLEKEKRMAEEEKLRKEADIKEARLAQSIAESKDCSGGATPSSELSAQHTDNSFDSSDGPSDGDVDPEDYLERYLSLQKRLCQLHPELTMVELRKGKKAKAKSTAVPSDLDTKSRKILKQLQAISSDILFDNDAALWKWAEIRPAYVADIAERHKFTQKNPSKVASKDTEKVSNQVAPASKPQVEPHDPTHDSDIDQDDDTGLDLGGFFSSLPDQAFNDKTGATETTLSADGAAVTIRSFGTWSGINPRRVLEEACKARDSSSQLKYSVTFSSVFSSKQNVRIQWSKAQDVPHSHVQLQGIEATMHDREIAVEMTTIACPDKTQSEAYVSTAALFLIFSSSPREEKARLRLPAVWRELWTEFADSKKEQLGRVDMDELRSIKKMVEEYRTQTRENLQDSTETKLNSKSTNGTQQIPPSSKSASQETTTDVVNVWQSKSSTPSFQRMLKGRMTLPIWAYRQELLQAIEENQAIVLCGETGCGKSTQVPSFLLEHELSAGRPCKIYCTEPRRISAISLARRVSEELGERKNDVGTIRSLIGYAIRLESQISSSSRLVFATTGIVMRMLESGNDLQDITHLVLDEVHERTIDSDFLLIVLRKLMVRRPELKVILMSATVNAEQFSKYLGGAPVLNVPGRTFPVDTRYLEDAIEVTKYGSDDQATRKTNREDVDDDEDIEKGIEHSTTTKELRNYSSRTKNVLADFDEYRLDYELIVRLLETVATDNRFVDYSKAILVFLPGMAEIRRLNDMLVGHKTFTGSWEIYPLHSTIATEEQERAFLVPPPGVRKIVLATNIAETGITIPDVTCVVDTGKHKEMRYDERRQLSRLIESFISRANAKQRRGRAGRVQNGLCFHMFTRARHDRIMAESQTPEMLRLSLQDLALRVKICKLGNIEQILSEALDPPSAKNIKRAIDSLVDVKALTTGEELTALGRQLAKLPLDVYLGKLILQSNIFRCLDAGLTIAAILSSKSPFQAPMGARSQADSVRLAFKRGDSDLLTVYNAYCSWKRVCTSSGTSEFQFCRKNFLSSQTLSNIEDLKAQLTTALVDARLLALDDKGRASLNRARFYSRQRHFVEVPALSTVNSDNDLVVDSVIAWSFYPKLLIREGKGYRNVANNQNVSLHPTSVNKSMSRSPRMLSFYQIMQSSNKFYNAQETSAVEDFAVALVCGDAEFKIYSGVIVIDGNRLRFSVTDWKVMLALKILRTQLRAIIAQTYRSPGRAFSASQQRWLDIWQEMFTRNMTEKA